MAAPAPTLAPPDLSRLPRWRLLGMIGAGEEILECYRVLEKAGLNIVGEMLRGHGVFYEFEHYPPDDVYDSETHSQYYYHAHREGEHGHFHTFLRRPGMPPGAEPVPHDDGEPWPEGDDALSHLIAISMDAYGKPIKLFTVNRWVCGDGWYPAHAVVQMIDRFAVHHASPSWPVNRWISAMLRLFRPYVEALLWHRDAVVETWRVAHPGVNVFEDRRLGVIGMLPVSAEGELERVRAALALRGG